MLRRWLRPGACKAEGMSHAENIHSAIPAVHRLMSSPAVHGALTSILGEGFALHPHTFMHVKDEVNGGDGDWHKRAPSPPHSISPLPLPVAQLTAALLGAGMDFSPGMATAFASTSRSGLSSATTRKRPRPRWDRRNFYPVLSTVRDDVAGPSRLSI